MRRAGRTEGGCWVNDNHIALRNFTTNKPQDALNASLIIVQNADVNFQGVSNKNNSYMCTHTYAGMLERHEHPFPIAALWVLLFNTPCISHGCCCSYSKAFFASGGLNDAVLGHT